LTIRNQNRAKREHLHRFVLIFNALVTPAGFSQRPVLQKRLDMKKTILSFFLCLTVFVAAAQQYPLFTNYILNDFGFNPAIAGSMPHWDARLTYRKQWMGIEDAPQTQIVSVQGPMKLFGLGGYFYNDTAGKLRRTGASAALCYGHNLPGLGHIGLGVSGGAYNFRLKGADSTLGSIDPLFANGGNGIWVPDLSAGLYLRMEKGLFLGFSAPQILRRQLQFSEEDVPNRELIPHYYGMAGYSKKLSDKLTLEPSVLVKYVKTTPLQFDFSLRALLNNKFWLGGSYRYKAAVTGMVGYEISRTMNLAYAFDYTMSTLRQAAAGSHEVTLGFKFGLPKDSDGDGCPDKEDQCPDKPGLKENSCCPEEMVDENGDRDLDGVANKDDKCPNEPGRKDNAGCPLGDRDQDGIRDDVDKCPDLFGIALNEGCPLDDRDKDGIIDAKDKCPDLPGPIARDGCPDKDKDGDGIVDVLDKCPSTPGLPENNGCPVATSAEKAILDLAIQNLYFDTGKDKIKQESYRFLDKLADLLTERPSLVVKISGHADNRGTDEFNLQLSKRRAEAVLFYLTNRGVPASQLLVAYYGESHPAASNTSENTRYLNRRVEMEFVWD
jgi:type IX secretion system PorP/SprF family membrane protein